MNRKSNILAAFLVLALLLIACGAGGVSKLVNQDTGLINRIFNYKYPAEYLSGFDTVLARKDELERFYGDWDHRDRTE